MGDLIGRIPEQVVLIGSMAVALILVLFAAILVLYTLFVVVGLIGGLMIWWENRKRGNADRDE